VDDVAVHHELPVEAAGVEGTTAHPHAVVNVIEAVDIKIMGKELGDNGENLVHLVAALLVVL
jgi:hypothetical protein